MSAGASKQGREEGAGVRRRGVGVEAGGSLRSVNGRPRVPAPRSINDIEFGKLIGSGLFGKVYFGRNKNNGEPLAVKEVSGASTRRKLDFLKEASMLRKLKHPNLLRLRAVLVQEELGDDGEDLESASQGSHPIEYKLYLVTEFCAAGSLSKWLLDPRRELPWPTRIRWALEAACGLLHLHGQNVIHRDLKSENCLLRDNGEDPDDERSNLSLVLADFGLSRYYRTEGYNKDSNEYKRPLTVVGTPWLMAPELIKAKSNIGYSVQAEVFTFGVLMLEILTRRRASDIPRRPDTLAIDLQMVELMSVNPPRALDSISEEGSDLGAEAIVGASETRRDSILNSTPPLFFELAAECVALEPQKRPTVNEIVERLEGMLSSELI